VKGQTQALTTILITTVTIGAIASAYVWGTPLLEKRSDKADLQQLENKVSDLHGEIESVGSGGSGTSSEISLELGKNGDLTVNEQKDYIEIETTAPSSPYPTSWILIDGSNLQNLSIGGGNYAMAGDDKSVVIAAKTLGSGNGASRIKYRIETRNMKTSGSKLEKIDLELVGKDREAGDVTLGLTNKGTYRDTNLNINDRLMEREKTRVEVDIQ
jgi:hypothetical protein